MGGHEEPSIDKNIPQELVKEWALKDPIVNFEQFLLDEKAITTSQITQIKNEIKTYIDSEWAIADKAKAFAFDVLEEVNDVYAEKAIVHEKWPTVTTEKDLANHPNTKIRFLESIKEGLQQSLIKHTNLVLMGQDIAEYGGVFKLTEGLVKEFGKERVRNTPLCESAIIGTALGLSLEGYKSVVEMQFADFVSVGFNQIVNNLAKIHYRWGQKAEVVIRMPTGAGMGAGPFHSQSNEAWFTHVPGLKVVYPSNPFDAKGLLIAAINDPNPVLFFEHKALYRSIYGNVPNEYYEVEIGKANLVNKGEDITIITYGTGVHWALEYQQKHPETSLHILDIRTLLPLDYNSIAYAVQKTGRVLILHEDTLTGGIGGEIGAWIAENCFSSLDAPILRCASLDTPIPFNTALEDQFLAKSRLHESITKLLSF
jgi:2-oxoisovalerate dehydrogenase E1 component